MIYSYGMTWLNWNRTIGIFVFLGLTVGIGFGGFLGWIGRDLPAVDVLTEYKPDIQTRVLDADGERIGRFYNERRLVLPRSKIPESVIQTLVAAEDQSFYSHQGFDVPGIARAILLNLKSFRLAQGASTISQQVARMMFLTNERKFSRKIREGILTAQIERKFSKDEIITIYLNQNCFGRGAYGIEAAARTFFQKSAAELTIPESAMLMSMLKKPVLFDPIKEPENAISGRNRVLRRMAESGFISEAEAETMIKEPLTLNMDSQEGFIAPYFVDHVRQQLFEKLGKETVTTGGLTVNTTLRRNHQEAANRAVEKGLSAFRKRHPEGNEIQAALLCMKVDTGEITAMIGGSSYRETRFNRSVQSKRQSGSAIKPFVYLTALRQGYTSSSILMDTPYEYTDPKTRKRWSPKNYDGKYRGPVTLRRSLEDSLNVPTAKLTEKVGLTAILETIHLAGIESSLPPYPSIALGAGEVTLIELVNAYGTLANKGLKVSPFLIESVEDSQSRVVYQPAHKMKEVFAAEECYLLTQILEGAVQFGTCWRARDLSVPVAAKTGTTNDYTNAWYIGYTPEYVTGVWVGYDLNESMGHGETGSRAAGPIFVDFMKEILAIDSPERFDVPSTLNQIRICHESGYRAGSNCPTTILESFKSGSEPRRVCPLHPSY